MNKPRRQIATGVCLTILLVNITVLLTPTSAPHPDALLSDEQSLSGFHFLAALFLLTLIQPRLTLPFRRKLDRALIRFARWLVRIWSDFRKVQ